MKLFEVRAELSHLGLHLGRGSDGAYRVTFEGDGSNARYAMDLETILVIGKEMAGLRDIEQTSIGRLESLAKRLREIAGTVKSNYVDFWTDRAEQLESWIDTLRSGREIDRTYAAQVVREFAATAGVTL